MRDIVFLEVAGINPIIVHGGGKAISRAMAEAGLEATFVGGLRVTDEAAIHIVEETLNNEFGFVAAALAPVLIRTAAKALGAGAAAGPPR